MTTAPECPRSRCFQRILLATNFSPAKRAFRTALDLARDVGAELHLLHVVNAPRHRTVFFVRIDPRSHEAITTRLRHKTRRRLDDFLRGEDLAGVQVITAFSDGHPHAEIMRYAAEQGVDLIVVGERPESRAQHLLQHMLFESVGERVRREAPCAVLTVR